MTTKLTSIPIRVENGRLVLDQDPDEMHLLADGATGFVVLPSEAVSRHPMKALEGAELLPTGTKIALPFKVTTPDPAFIEQLGLERLSLEHLGNHFSHLWDRDFATLEIGEPLRLKVNPKTLPSLHKCACYHPHFPEPLPSLNAAFTEISKLCETHRQRL